MGSSQGLLVFALIFGTGATVWRWRFLSRSYRAGMIVLGSLCLLYLIEDRFAAGRYFATLPVVVDYIVQLLPTVLILVGLLLLYQGARGSLPAGRLWGMPMQRVFQWSVIAGGGIFVVGIIIGLVVHHGHL